MSLILDGTSGITNLTSINGGQLAGRRNIVYNGEMKVAQRSTSVTGLGGANGYFTLDRFKIGGGTTAGRFTMTQTADGPVGFANCMKLDCTTADTSIAANEYLFIRQLLEGQDVQQLKKGTASAEQVTVSFYVKGNANATYTVELEDRDNSRYNSQEFSVTTAWNRIELIFAADTTGAFNDDNAESLALNIWLHSGSTYTGGTHTDNVWHTTNNQRVGDSQTSFYDATSRTFFITGVQMEIGATATEFEHRSFGEEMLLCKRYCNVIAPVADEGFAIGHNRTTTTSVGIIRHNPVMRTAPSLTFSAVNAFQVHHANTATQTSGIAAGEQSTEGSTIVATVGSGLTAGQGSQIREHTSGATIIIDAEL